ncbi:MAG TPA: DMT family transporter [Spirochaetota bacterium]|nr:DMT family transporter [Spirochaetota bacterium]HNT11445.1 DMT family transporter [Spirochaetota bacterium]
MKISCQTGARRRTLWRNRCTRGGAAIWIVLSVACALFLALADLVTKKYCSAHGPFEIAFGRVLFALPALWAFALIDGIPAVDPGIVPVYLIALPLELGALVMYMRAITISPLSLTVPFLSFTPAFLAVSAPVMLGEHASPAGVLGIAGIVAGAYALHLPSVRRGALAPVMMIVRERGSLLMLGVAFIYSITSLLGKRGVLCSSPSFFAATYFTLLALPLFALATARGTLRSVFSRELVAAGLLAAAMISFHMAAIRIAPVSYMIAIKRASLLFGIVFGSLFCGETGLREKLVGGLLMVAGMLGIAIWG